MSESTPVRHGRYTTYTNGRCRGCVECRAANAAKMEALRRSRYAERVERHGRLVHPRATHGTANAYNYMGCRCERCQGANRVAQQKRAQRRRGVTS